MSWIADIKAKAKIIKRDSIMLYFAVKDPRTPITVKLLAGAIVAYALSPIDLIPDFIPVLGFLDEVILLPIAIAFAVKLLPTEVIESAREKALAQSQKPRSYFGATIVIFIWMVCALLIYKAFK